jgi:hypothetical protein
MLLVAGHIVEHKKPLSPPLGEAFEDVDGIVNLFEKIVSIEVPITIFSSLEYNPGFPGGCEYE